MDHIRDQILRLRLGVCADVEEEGQCIEFNMKPYKCSAVIYRLIPTNNKVKPKMGADRWS